VRAPRIAEVRVLWVLPPVDVVALRAVVADVRRCAALALAVAQPRGVR